MDDGFWEDIERSRQMTPQQRFVGALAMFDLSRSLMLAGIRDQFPDADEEQVQLQLLRRLKVARDLDALP